MSELAEVWTCPHCGKTYRMPGHWEAAVYLAARRAAQTIHASRHGYSALLRGRARASDRRPREELPPDWADPEWAEPAPEDRREH